MELFAGTSGFSYPEWKGPFYPAELPETQWLAYYAARLPAVEINNTFYRMPREDMLVRWTESVPEGFRFVLKAPQRITHKGRLEGTAESVAYLWKTAASLKRHLGPFLFQLPPYLRANVERLRRFLSELPEGMRAAFEFRHESWDQPAVTDALREAGCALCTADNDPAEEAESQVKEGAGAGSAGAPAADAEPDPPIVATADFGYLRLRRAAYSDAELDAWAERIQAQASRWVQVYVFFKHEDAGAAPAMAARLSARFSTPAKLAYPSTEVTSRWP